MPCSAQTERSCLIGLDFSYATLARGDIVQSLGSSWRVAAVSGTTHRSAGGRFGRDGKNSQPLCAASMTTSAGAKRQAPAGPPATFLQLLLLLHLFLPPPQQPLPPPLPSSATWTGERAATASRQSFGGQGRPHAIQFYPALSALLSAASNADRQLSQGPLGFQPLGTHSRADPASGSFSISGSGPGHRQDSMAWRIP